MKELGIHQDGVFTLEPRRCLFDDKRNIMKVVGKV